MAVPKSSLSAGAIIRQILLEDSDVAALTTKVFPVAIDKADLPYILYRRAELSSSPQKSRQPGNDEIQMEVVCFTGQYGEGVKLAEAVRGALDFATAEFDGMKMRSCYLTGGEESYQEDAYVQQLIFTIKI